MSELKLGPLEFNSASKQDMLAIVLQHLHAKILRTEKPDTLTTGATGFCIGYINPHVYNLSNTQSEVRSFINQCNLICLDGLGVCLVLKMQYGWFKSPRLHRVVALQLFDTFMEELAQPCSAVLIGVDTADVQLSAAAMTRLNENLSITGTLNGFGRTSDYEAFLVKHATTDLILVGAGTPKSESIALQARSLCPHAIIFHIGAGTIKVYAGTKRRAPSWVSSSGLEWLHRMIFEPHTRERYIRGGWRFFRHSLNTTQRDNTKSLP